jgi:hypothetical protein
MATPRDTPYVWTTWMTKLMAGAECRFCDITRQGYPQRIDMSPLDIKPAHDLC